MFVNIKHIGKIQQTLVKTVQVIAYNAILIQLVNNVNLQLINGTLHHINVKGCVIIFPNITIQQQDVKIALILIVLLAML